MYIVLHVLVYNSKNDIIGCFNTRTPEVVEMPEWNFTESELEPEPSGDHLPGDHLPGTCT